MALTSNISVGLDVGQTTTKLVVVKGNGSTPKVVKSALFSSWEEGLVSEVELAEHLGPWLKEQGIGQKEVILGIQQYLAIAQLSDFPPASAQQLDELVEMETQHLAGLSDEAFLHDYRVLEPFDSQVNPVLIGVCRESATRQRLEPLLEHDINVVDLSMDGQGLVTAYETLVPADVAAKESLSLVLDVGAENTTMAIMQHGQCVYVGSFTAGGHLFTQALMRQMGMSEMEAERTKRGSRILPTDLESPLTMAARAFSGELYAALENWRYQSAGTDDDVDMDASIPVKMIYLSGGGSLLGGFDEYMGQLFECPVKVLAPVVDKGLGKGEHFAIAYGLALQAFAVKTKRISLAPLDVAWTAQRKRRVPLLMASFVFLTAALGLWLVTSYWAEQKQKAYLDANEARLSECSTLIGDLEKKATKVHQMEAMLQPFVARGNRNTTFIQTTELLSKYKADKDWFVFLADEESYHGRQRLMASRKESTEDARSVFANSTAGGEAQPVKASVILATEVRPWQALVASGFTPVVPEDPWGNLRKVVDALNTQPDSIFAGVDSMPEGNRSVVDFRIIPKWKERYGMRSFAIRLPLRQMEFEIVQTEAE